MTIFISVFFLFFMIFIFICMMSNDWDRSSLVIASLFLYLFLFVFTVLLCNELNKMYDRNHLIMDGKIEYTINPKTGKKELILLDSTLVETWKNLK